MSDNEKKSVKWTSEFDQKQRHSPGLNNCNLITKRRAAIQTFLFKWQVAAMFIGLANGTHGLYPSQNTTTNHLYNNFSHDVHKMTKQASFEVQSNAAHGADKRLNSSLPAATLEGSSNSFH